MQDFNWYSVPKQVESVRKLLQFDFVHICPGSHPNPLLLCPCPTVHQKAQDVLQMLSYDDQLTARMSNLTASQAQAAVRSGWHMPVGWNPVGSVLANHIIALLLSEDTHARTA